MSSHRESFTVLNITREDVTHAIGYNLGAELDDQEMGILADKLGEALFSIDFWGILAEIIESWLECKKTTIKENK